MSLPTEWRHRSGGAGLMRLRLVALSLILCAAFSFPKLAHAVEPTGASGADRFPVLQSAGVAAQCDNPALQRENVVNGGAIRINLTANNTNIQPNTPLHELTLQGGTVLEGFCFDVFRNQRETLQCLSTTPIEARLVYLLDNYPPAPDNNVNQAARQAAVWHYTNDAILRFPDSTNGSPEIDTQVTNTYNAILQDVEAAIPDVNNPPPLYQPGALALTVTPTDALNQLPVQSAQPLTVRITKGGQPLSGLTVNMATTFGALDVATAPTNANGEAVFVVSSTVRGSAILTPSVTLTVPGAVLFEDEAAPAEWQPIGVAAPSTVTLTGRAAVTWVIPTNLDPEDEPVKQGGLLFLPNIRR